MKTIPLTQGLFALVDEADYEILSQFKWYAQKIRHTAYAVRAIQIDGKVCKALMHRVLLGDAAAGSHVDHRDGDGLNNTRCNLRACSHAENNRNRRINKVSATGFKGVGTQKGSLVNPYRARIHTNGESKYLGCFPTPELAHAAYCEAARRFYGDFARFV
jgi:hypothetical protein